MSVKVVCPGCKKEIHVQKTFPNCPYCEARLKIIYPNRLQENHLGQEPQAEFRKPGRRADQR